MESITIGRTLLTVVEGDITSQDVAAVAAFVRNHPQVPEVRCVLFSAEDAALYAECLREHAGGIPDRP